MGKQHWLVKQEPDSYAWESFVRDGSTSWEGVRNYQARNNLKAMKTGDAVLFYASGDSKSVIGLATVQREAFPDPSADEDGWVTVELKAGKALSRPVTLTEIKADAALAAVPLIRHTRLSVMPLQKTEFDRIVALAKT